MTGADRVEGAVGDAPWLRVLAAGIVGGFAAPVLATTAFFWLWALQTNGGSALPLGVVLAAGAFVAVAAFAVVERASPAPRAGRWTRAVVVFVGGLVGWLAGAWVNASIGAPLPFPGPAALLLGGVPFALVAALLLGGRWRVVAGALALLAVVGGVLLVDAENRRRADTELLGRLSGIRDLVYVVDIPSHPFVTRGDVSASYDPGDPNVGVPGEVYQERTISLSAERGSFDCGSAVLSVALGRDERPVCVQEAPGLWYLTGSIPTPEWGCPCGLQQYVRQDGGTLLSVGASDAVPRATLRDAVLAARRATDDDLRRLAAAEG